MCKKGIAPFWIKPRAVELGAMIEIVSHSTNVAEKHLDGFVGGWYIGPYYPSTIGNLFLRRLIKYVLSGYCKCAQFGHEILSYDFVSESIPINKDISRLVCLEVSIFFERGGLPRLQ